MEINGLPLHPLVVHATVVFTPIAALTALAYVLLSRWRERLRWPMVIMVVLALGSVWVAFYTGLNLRDSHEFLQQGDLGEKIDKHMTLANYLRWTTTGFAVVAGVTSWQHDSRSGAVRAILNILLAATALGTLVLVVLTGDAGSRAAYSGL